MPCPRWIAIDSEGVLLALDTQSFTLEYIDFKGVLLAQQLYQGPSCQGDKSGTKTKMRDVWARLTKCNVNNEEIWPRLTKKDVNKEITGLFIDQQIGRLFDWNFFQVQLLITDFIDTGFNLDAWKFLNLYVRKYIINGGINQIKTLWWLFGCFITVDWKIQNLKWIQVWKALRLRQTTIKMKSIFNDAIQHHKSESYKQKIHDGSPTKKWGMKRGGLLSWFWQLAIRGCWALVITMLCSVFQLLSLLRHLCLQLLV